MSKPRYDWWGYVKGMIRRYPYLKRVDNWGTALCEEKAVEAAISLTERMENGSDRLKVIDLVFWEETHKISGAALQIPCSERTAQRWHADFIKLVAKNFNCKGLL